MLDVLLRNGSWAGASCRRESREAALACASARVAPAVMKIGWKIGGRRELAAAFDDM